MQTRQSNLEGTGEIPLRRLVKEALRMRPARLIVGEVRQEECLDLLIALNSGVPKIVETRCASAAVLSLRERGLRELQPREQSRASHGAAGSH